MIILPWQQSVFDGWSIVGMNHYRVDGRRHLFVSMAKRGRCIKVEGFDCPELWAMLADQVWVTECSHEWFDMRNAAVQSGEMCKLCGEVRAGNATADTRAQRSPSAVSEGVDPK